MEILDSLAKIGFDWQVALANFVNFLIIFWLLKRFVFAPMQDKFKERRETIEKGIEDAKIAERERTMAEAKKEKIVEGARGEANTIVADARNKEQEIIEEAKSEAQKEQERIRKEAQKALEREKNDMKESLRHETADLIISSVEKILKEEVDEKKNKELIDSITKNS